MLANTTGYVCGFKFGSSCKRKESERESERKLRGRKNGKREMRIEVERKGNVRCIGAEVCVSPLHETYPQKSDTADEWKGGGKGICMLLSFVQIQKTWEGKDVGE